MHKFGYRIISMLKFCSTRCSLRFHRYCFYWTSTSTWKSSYFMQLATRLIKICMFYKTEISFQILFLDILSRLSRQTLKAIFVVCTYIFSVYQDFFFLNTKLKFKKTFIIYFLRVFIKVYSMMSSHFLINNFFYLKAVCSCMCLKTENF